MILVERMLRKTTANMGNMREQVLRFLKREDKQNYQEWLTRQQIEGHITQSQVSARWSSFLTLPMEAKRQRANQAREALDKQVVPWNFGMIQDRHATTNQANGAKVRGLWTAARSSVYRVITDRDTRT